MIDQTSDLSPLRALCEQNGPGVLAIVVGTEGPAYRSVGASMAFLSEGRRMGSLSSGCIEDDLALQADGVLNNNLPKQLRYGVGSPFFDLQLPCGGALDVLLVPVTDKQPLEDILSAIDGRLPRSLSIDYQTGSISSLSNAATGFDNNRFVVALRPELHMAVFGSGIEAVTFAGMARAAGYLVTLGSPDEAALDAARQMGCAVLQLDVPGNCPSLSLDPYSAAVLFFHDHDWEPEILAQALKTEAFFIGAQGSKRTHEARCLALEAMGISPQKMAQLRGPIGLIPSSRDPRTLAISVLADVVASFGRSAR